MLLRFMMMVLGLAMVPVRHMSGVTCFPMITSFRVFLGFVMMMSGFLVMFCGVFVML